MSRRIARRRIRSVFGLAACLAAVAAGCLVSNGTAATASPSSKSSKASNRSYGPPSGNGSARRSSAASSESSSAGGANRSHGYAAGQTRTVPQGAASSARSGHLPLEYWLQQRSKTVFTEEQFRAINSAKVEYFGRIGEATKTLLDETARILNEDRPKNAKVMKVDGKVVIPRKIVFVRDLRTGMLFTSTSELYPMMPIPTSVGRGGSPYTPSETRKWFEAFQKYQLQIRPERDAFQKKLAAITGQTQVQVALAIQESDAHRAKVIQEHFTGTNKAKSR